MSQAQRQAVGAPMSPKETSKPGGKGMWTQQRAGGPDKRPMARGLFAMGGTRAAVYGAPMAVAEPGGCRSAPLPPPQGSDAPKGGHGRSNNEDTSPPWCGSFSHHMGQVFL